MSRRRYPLYRSGGIARRTRRSGIAGANVLVHATGPGDRDNEYGRIKTVSLSVTSATKGDGMEVQNDAAYVLAYRIRAALDPVRVPSKVRTLASMNPEEVAAIEAQHGMKVEPRDPEELRRKRRLIRIKKLVARRASKGHTVLSDVRRAMVEEAQDRQEEAASTPTEEKKPEQKD